MFIDLRYNSSLKISFWLKVSSLSSKEPKKKKRAPLERGMCNVLGGADHAELAFLSCRADVWGGRLFLFAHQEELAGGNKVRA